MEKRIKYGTALLAFILAILALYSYLSHKNDNYPARIQKAAITVDAGDLVQAFEKNESFSNQEYVDKIVSVRGFVKNIRKNEQGNYVVALGSSHETPFLLSCSLDKLYDLYDLPVKVGDSCTISGTCAGLLINIILLQCVVEK